MLPVSLCHSLEIAQRSQLALSVFIFSLEVSIKKKQKAQTCVCSCCHTSDTLMHRCAHERTGNMYTCMVTRSICTLGLKKPCLKTTCTEETAHVLWKHNVITGSPQPHNQQHPVGYKHKPVPLRRVA